MSFHLLKSTPVRKTEYSKDDLSKLAHCVLMHEKVKNSVELTLDFVPPTRIRALNRRFRGVDRNTDVIAFRYDLNPTASLTPTLSLQGRGSSVRDGFSGDIAINIPQARLQAKKMHHPVKREIRLLLIHGILHLLGYTDYEPRPRRRMFKRQNQLLRRWEKQGLRSP